MIPTDDMCRAAREKIGIGSNVADHVWRVMAEAAGIGVQQHAKAALSDGLAYTVEQVRKQFIDHVRHLAGYWEREQRATTDKESLRAWHLAS